MRAILLRMTAIENELGELAKSPEARQTLRRTWLVLVQALMRETRRLKDVLEQERAILCKFVQELLTESIQLANSGHLRQSGQLALLAKDVTSALYSQHGLDLDILLHRLERDFRGWSECPGLAERLASV